MKLATTYPVNQGKAFLLLGKPGVGKSCLLPLFPKPYVLDFDRNLGTAAEMHPEPFKKLYYDQPQLDDAGSPLPPDRQFERAVLLLREAAKSPDIQTICIDSLTTLVEALKAHVIRLGSGMEKSIMVGGMNVMTLSLWQPFALKLTELIYALRNSGKMLVMTAHVAVDQNTMTDIKEWQVLVQGSSRDTIGSCFTDIYLLQAKPVGVEPKYPRGAKYVINTAPTLRMESLRCSTNLPPEVEASSKEFLDMLARLGQQGAAVAAASAAPAATKP